MHVSILTPDLSHNCLGRAYVLAQLLERRHTVEIVGPELGDGIWEPLRGEYLYKRLELGTFFPDFPLNVRELTDKITGDVVYASKPKMTSYGVGLLHTLGEDVPLLLDIDDWELGFKYGNKSPFLAHLKHTRHMLNLNSTNYTWMLERLSVLADDQTVSNQYLQDRFGGTTIPHARDTNAFDPSKFDARTIRTELDLPSDKTLVMFIGTPRPHKGVDDMITAIRGIDCDDIIGVIVGAGDSSYVQALREMSPDEVIIRGSQPFDQLPKWIAAGDIMVIPQRRNPATRGQLPAKVFDAMAMAKPVISTDINDLPKVLDKCGLIVSPDSPNEIADAIEYLHANPSEQEKLGRRAREKCIEKYSFDAVAPKLDRIVIDVT